MLNKKIFRFLKRYYIIITTAIILIIIASYFLFSSENDNATTLTDLKVTVKNDTISVQDISRNASKDIDSIFRQFGIKDTWIITKYPNEKKQIKDKKTDEGLKGSWFGKYISIPPDVNSIEINFELTSYARQNDLQIVVNEEITRKDLFVSFHRNDDSALSSPLIKLIIRHDDKVKRDEHFFTVIISNITDFKNDEIDELIKNGSDLSFLVPYSLDHFDLINKLNHEKKDVILELTAGKHDNYETDFHAGQNEKEIKQKVKSILYDYRSVKNVLITRKDNIQAGDKSVLPVRSELENNNILVYPDSVISDHRNDVTNTILKKMLTTRSGILLVRLSYNDLSQLRDGMLILKKSGHKFLTASEYVQKAEKEKLALRKKQEDENKAELQKQIEKKKQQDAANRKKQESLKKKQPVKKTDKSNIKKKNVKN